MDTLFLRLGHNICTLSGHQVMHPKMVFNADVKTTGSSVKFFMRSQHLGFVGFESVFFMFTTPCRSFGAKLMDFRIACADAF